MEILQILLLALAAFLAVRSLYLRFFMKKDDCGPDCGCH